MTLEPSTKVIISHLLV